MSEENQGRGLARLSRRGFMKGVGTGVVGSAVVGGTQVLAPEADAAQGGAESLGPGPVKITLSINGKDHQLTVEPRTTLLSALRNYMPADQALTGAKPGCEMGTCGACSVLIDGKAAYSCLQLAVDAQGKRITTVEGLARDGRLTPVQQAMVEKDGYMCGFCTPGFVIAMTALLRENPKPSLDEIKTGLSGNLCRCGAYEGILKAALAASGQEGRG